MFSRKQIQADGQHEKLKGDRNRSFWEHSSFYPGFGVPGIFDTRFGKGNTAKTFFRGGWRLLAKTYRSLDSKREPGMLVQRLEDFRRS